MHTVLPTQCHLIQELYEIKRKMGFKASNQEGLFKSLLLFDFSVKKKKNHNQKHQTLQLRNTAAS